MSVKVKSVKAPMISQDQLEVPSVTETQVSSGRNIDESNQTDSSDEVSDGEQMD